jgi:hypothetical protein
MKKRHTEPLRKLLAMQEQLLREHMNPSSPAGACEDYEMSISFGRKRDGRRTPFTQIYWDARFGFVLSSSDNPASAIACLGFDFFWQGLGIVQIQGVEGKQDFLRPLRWEQLLVRTAVEYARILEMRHVLMPCAARRAYNPLYNDELRSLAKLSQEACEARAKRLYLAYDKTAEKCGFIYKPEWRAFALTL